LNEISAGLPTRELDDGTTSQVTIVPFYDRTQLIYETLGTLNDAIILQILISIIVIIVMVYHLRTSSAHLGPAAHCSAYEFYHDAVFRSRCQHRGTCRELPFPSAPWWILGIIMNENILRHMQEAKT
jgi:copper/silver efflux system protein